MVPVNGIFLCYDVALLGIDADAVVCVVCVHCEACACVGECIYSSLALRPELSALCG